jgi:hypothetical protein
MLLFSVNAPVTEIAPESAAIELFVPEKVIVSAIN